MTRRRLARWRVERCTGPAAVLLDPWPPVESQDHPIVRASRVSGGGALVLGSTQDRAVVDEEHAAASGIDVVRRPTGGGAVLVAPGAQVWLDLWVPRRHALWDDDIVRAATWLGDVWVEALEGLGVGSLRVHRGPATRRPWSDLVCFAGLGPGEVHLAGPQGAGPEASGPKVTGIAQRRTRAGARFHTSAPLAWDPGPLLRLLTEAVDVVDDDDRRRSVGNAAVGLRALVPPWRTGVADDDVVAAVEDAVVDALP
ncbi:MAG TPA: hypothetical protein VN791_01645 [Acidimicrobiales bacterium]|nr:hypothetical protein [Acidimicrobiales bacterium]